MPHGVRRLAFLLVSMAVLTAPALAWGVPLDGSTPTLSTSPINITLGAGASVAYRVPLAVGETLVVSLSPAGGAPANLDLDLYLYGPSATQTLHGSAIAKSVWPAATYPETISYQVSSAGSYYLEVYGYEGAGDCVLTWSVVPEQLVPVYRFYNVRNATHFYTPDEAERARVQTTLASTYQFEGVAYYTRPSNNSQLLYRFFNRRSGSHFYTASDSERDNVLNNLGSIFSYDGPTYLVSTTPAVGKLAVYRFYNRRNGSHFYTASDAERDNVINNLGYMYSFEGPAFYVGQ